MKINQIKAGTFLSYTAIIANIIIQLIYTPIMLRLLGQSEYGVYTLAASVISYLSLFSMGFAGAYTRFFSRYKVQNDEENIAKLNGIFLLTFSVLAVLVFACGLILVYYSDFIFGNKITVQERNTAQKLMLIMICNIAITLINSVFNCILAARERFVFQRGIDLLTKVINPFLALPLLLLGYGSVGMTCITTTLSCINILINLYYVKKILHVKFIFQGIDPKLFREIGGFSFWIFLNMVIDQINWNVDKLILGRICGSVAVAVYGVGAQLNNLYLQFSVAISSVFGPKINFLIAQGKDDTNSKLTELFVKVGRIQFVVLLYIATGITFFGKGFIVLWAGEEYVAAYYMVLCLIWPGIISLTQNLGIEIQRAKNMHRFRSKVYLFMAVINIIITIPLTGRYGVVGAAMGTANSIVIANIIIMNIYYHKKIGLNMMEYWKNILGFVPVIIVVFSMGMICNIMLDTSTWLTLILTCGVYSVFYWTIMWFWGINKEEKNQVRKMINRKRKE